MTNRAKFFLTLYIACLHLLVVVVISKSDFLQRVSKRIGLKPEITQGRKVAVRRHLGKDACVPEGAVLFVGASITQGLCVSAVTDKGINFGISGDTTVGVLYRIGLYTSLARARAVVLAIGLNDTYRRPNDETAANHEKIIAKIPRDIPVVLSAVLPVDERMTKKYRNAKIFELNKLLKSVCSRRENCHFSDSVQKMLDGSGNLKAEYHAGDGVHLSAEGYRVWIEDLKNALKVNSHLLPHLYSWSALCGLTIK